MKKRAYSLVEVMISITVFVVISAGVFSGLKHIQGAFSKSKSLINTRKQLTNFSNTLTSFANKSLNVYFDDSTNDAITPSEFHALSLPLDISNHSFMDQLYFTKSATETAKMNYDFTAASGSTKANGQIKWFSNSSGQNFKTVLNGVFRKDASFDDDGNLISEGVAPVFRFPHNISSAWNTDGPRFIIVEFKKLVSDTNNNIVLLPVSLMASINFIE